MPAGDEKQAFITLEEEAGCVVSVRLPSNVETLVVVRRRGSIIGGCLT